eukprot:365655-Chlamydomonas_euryale.AAC.2
MDGAMYSADRCSLALATADKMAQVRTMENLSRYQQTQPEMVTIRLVELVDKSKGYMKRLRTAEEAESVVSGRNVHGRGRPYNT